MSLLAALASGSSGVAIPPTDPDTPTDTTPYAMPTSAPYNAPVYAITPTPDGTGSLVHPDVIDFGASGWNDWRYWMAVTPYYMANASKENPIVLVSHDGFTWQAPTGAAPAYLFNPLATSSAQSDTDMVYDPVNDRLVMTWREYKYAEPYNEWIYASTSTDGVTWSSPRVTLWMVSEPGDDRADNSPSQAIVRVTDGDWRAFVRTDLSPGVAGGYGGIAMRTATDPLGPWGEPTDGTLSIGAPQFKSLWHLDVIRHDGMFWGLFDYVWEHRAAVSTDGLAWTIGPAHMTNRLGEWDDTTIYRATIQPHENGTHMRCWYSSDGSANSWRVGFTQLPTTLWTDLY